MQSLNGRLGQVTGPFKAKQDLLKDGGKIGRFTPEGNKPILYKLGIQTKPNTKIKINDIEIKIGPTGTYELDGIVDVKSLAFMEDGTDENTIVDFVY